MSYPSIFNDVIGPVMRGPSSSHCAASLRIGRIARDLMGGKMKEIDIVFDPNGSLATTHKGQGSDMGLFGGFLGWEAHDARLEHYQQHADDAGLQITIDIRSIGATHPNTYQLSLRNDNESHTMTALSTGGGMIEIINIDGAPLFMGGDYHETLVYTSQPDAVVAYVKARVTHDEVMVHKGSRTFVEVKSGKSLTSEQKEEIQSLNGVDQIRMLQPVLPVLSRKDLSVPFITAEEMEAYNLGKHKALWELAVDYECARGNITPAEVMKLMGNIVDIMRNAITEGLKGTKYKDRILGAQSQQYKQHMAENTLVAGDVMNTVILYTSAMMEVKSSMGVIVAAPTAGSCGALPGAVFGTADALGLSREEIIKAMLAAGLIGVFIAAHATFAAEVGGCMAECGSGCGMAAAGIVTLQGGKFEQTIGAASMALQTSLGMVCDMIANRVEAPCLNRNVMAATNAIACANMALASYNHLIPLDEVVQTMKKIGDVMPNTLRCTGLGGLAVTKTAKRIEAMLDERSPELVSKGFKVC